MEPSGVMDQLFLLKFEPQVLSAVSSNTMMHFFPHPRQDFEYPLRQVMVLSLDCLVRGSVTLIPRCVQVQKIGFRKQETLLDLQDTVCVYMVDMWHRAWCIKWTHLTQEIQCIILRLLSYFCLFLTSFSSCFIFQFIMPKSVMISLNEKTKIFELHFTTTLVKHYYKFTNNIQLFDQFNFPLHFRSRPP